MSSIFDFVPHIEGWTEKWVLKNKVKNYTKRGWTEIVTDVNVFGETRSLIGRETHKKLNLKII